MFHAVRYTESLIVPSSSFLSSNLPFHLSEMLLSNRILCSGVFLVSCHCFEKQLNQHYIRFSLKTGKSDLQRLIPAVLICTL